MPVNIARTETQMLLGPVRNGTAAATLGNFPRPIAGKTGTTDRNVDAGSSASPRRSRPRSGWAILRVTRSRLNPFFNVRRRERRHDPGPHLARVHGEGPRAVSAV